MAHILRPWPMPNVILVCLIARYSLSVLDKVTGTVIKDKTGKVHLFHFVILSIFMNVFWKFKDSTHVEVKEDM